jgi:Uma2 family endonuclease
MTATIDISTPESVATHPVLLRGISWAVYESMLRDLERSGQRIYLTYDRGILEIMPPSPFHERYKRLIGRFIDTISLERGIPIVGLGSTTFRREDLERGVEPDECYYVQHEAEMGARFELDLRKDPPPDLAVEMEYTRHLLDRVSVYSALGVPEIWKYDGERLTGLQRGDEGGYHPITKSAAFPFLNLADVERFLNAARNQTEDVAVRAFRDWVRQNYAAKP